MQLEDYFAVLDADDIRIKGHRIGIEDLLLLYLDGYSPEEIAVRFPSLRLDQIYATLTYYHARRTEIDAYLVRLATWEAQREQEAASQPEPEIVRRLKALRAQQRNEQLAL
jgi:uncharacterized protein (DUF433 family)